MPRQRIRGPAIRREDRRRRQLNEADDLAALRRLEDSMNQADQNSRPIPPHQDELFNHRNDTFEDRDEELNLQPGLEDDADDSEDDQWQTWVTLDEEEPDAIDLMVQASNERHRQRAREFNWKSLLDYLHPAYMVQKVKTSNWAGSNSYHDFWLPCQCGPQAKTRRSVDLIDINAQRRVNIEFCRCTRDPVRLLYLGYLAGSPVYPQTAFSVPLLILHNHLWNNCHVDALPFTTALTHFLEPRSQRLHVRRGQANHARDTRKPFSAAVDLYRQLEEKSDSLIHTVLCLDDRKILASLSCPACFGPQPLDSSMYPETTRDRLVVCLDGNFQHRHHSNASRNHEQLRTPRIFLQQTDVDKAKELIREKEMLDNTPEQVDRCAESHKAADDKRNESTWKGCDDTGLMGCCCRHDSAIYLANIHKSGEQRCFPLALIQRLLSVVEPNRPVGILYDIGCSMDKFINLRNILPEDRPRIKFGTSVFHAYVHNWMCQLAYHPRFNKGWGLSDGEGLERMWSYLSKLVSPLRYATRNHRLGSLAHRLAHHNKRGIRQLSYWMRKKFNKAVQRRRETRQTLATLLSKRNPHSSSGRNYTKAFFMRQWSAQRSFQADHTDVEELRMKRMVAMYQRENVIELMRCRLRNPRLLWATESEVQDLLDSLEAESEKLRDEINELAGENEPASNVEERKMRLLLWSAKSDLFVEAVHLRAERQPLLDSKNNSLRLGTKRKEKIFKAINARRPAIVKVINEYNLRYSQYKLKFPNQNDLESGEDHPLTYERLTAMSLDDAFWNNGLFYHCDAPWAIDSDVREGITCVLILSRAEEEFELIAQELVRMMAWAIELHGQIVSQIAYTQQRISLLRTSTEVADDHLDQIPMANISRFDKVQSIQKELLSRLANHNDLVEEWSENVVWLWNNCQPTQNQEFMTRWNKLLEDIQQEKLDYFPNLDNIDDDLEQVISGEVVDDGEDAEEEWIDVAE
ncbi:hypothetical protein PTTG_03307 [Puccinia triticina 1-1 BBBD Race 1]|uniref:CxC1 domain-containing protein n=1 Tax=Puccinia triticina (isolate 1-1 / race 1 (BBBD)) TaxID=630390 RepID=A0A180G1V4_PUCT1|nr:hypothetical protein PTTG_03307 [Puccinia triticina 1-1 BBBD Race 1]